MSYFIWFFECGIVIFRTYQTTRPHTTKVRKFASYILKVYNPTIQYGNCVIITYAHSETLSKWNIWVLRLTPFVFHCQTVWIENLRFWKVLWVALDTQHWHKNCVTSWKYYCSIFGRRWQFIVAETRPIQKWKYRIFSHSLCEHKKRKESR